MSSEEERIANLERWVRFLFDHAHLADKGPIHQADDCEYCESKARLP
jgi:hypothetical protein